MGEGIPILGFNDEIIVHRLQNPSSKLDIVSIFGMGEETKKTLAKNVYNHGWVKPKFPARAWCTIPEFLTRDLLMGMINDILSTDPSSCDEGLDKLDEYELAKFLTELLKGKKYFIVLDDICRTEMLQMLRNLFPDDNNGSRILLTTRIRSVAMMANPDSDQPNYIVPPDLVSTSTQQE